MVLDKPKLTSPEAAGAEILLVATATFTLCNSKIPLGGTMFFQLEEFIIQSKLRWCGVVGRVVEMESTRFVLQPGE